MGLFYRMCSNMSKIYDLIRSRFLSELRVPTCLERSRTECPARIKLLDYYFLAWHCKMTSKHDSHVRAGTVQEKLKIKK